MVVVHLILNWKHAVISISLIDYVNLLFALYCFHVYVCKRNVFVLMLRLLCVL